MAGPHIEYFTGNYRSLVHTLMFQSTYQRQLQLLSQSVLHCAQKSSMEPRFHSISPFASPTPKCQGPPKAFLINSSMTKVDKSGKMRNPFRTRLVGSNELDSSLRILKWPKMCQCNAERSSTNFSAIHFRWRVPNINVPLIESSPSNPEKPRV